MSMAPAGTTRTAPAGPSSNTIDEFCAAITAAHGEGALVKLALRDYHGGEPALKSVDVRPILVKRVPKLSFTSHYATRDIVKNYDAAESAMLVAGALDDGFRKATLHTTEFDLHFDNGRLRRAAASQTVTPSLAHDRDKVRLIGNSDRPWLKALNIADAQGNILKTAQDKYRQINRYVEVLSPLLKTLPGDKPLTVVDMGAGKGYLTFALADYLKTNLQRDATVTGVEVRPDLVRLCNEAAQASGLTRLSFVEGTIDRYDAAGADVLIALHACDTATDDAIAKGIAAGAELIVVAPCCHKQIRREIESHHAHNDLDFLTRHGIFLERQAEMVTDSIRAMVLEYFGYATKVFEFISDAHTPKNVLIVGRKTRAQRDAGVLDRIRDAKAYFGIGVHHLERATGLVA